MKRQNNLSFYSIIGFIAISCFLVSCQKQDPSFFSGVGKKPIYIPLTELDNIQSLPPQSIEQTGPIFLLDTLFFMTEIKKGIHIFNVKDSSSVKNLGFLNIPAVTDFTISNNVLYADSWTDLVTIDVSDLQNIRLLSREANAFEPLLYPTLYRGIFECVDVSLGAVVGWSDTFLTDAKCQTFF